MQDALLPLLLYLQDKGRKENVFSVAEIMEDSHTFLKDHNANDGQHPNPLVYKSDKKQENCR